VTGGWGGIKKFAKVRKSIALIGRNCYGNVISARKKAITTCTYAGP
jgi:hypothetical protein